MPAPTQLYEVLPKDRERLAAGTEKTGRQAKGGIAGVMSNLPGFGKPGPGTYALYRQMANDPTVAFAKAMATAPIRAAEHTWEKDDEAPEARLEFIRNQIEPRWRWLISNALRAMEFGWQGFELVHELVDGQSWGLSGEWIGYRKVKPLLQDLPTDILEDRETGAYGGLQQGKIKLPPPKTWTFIYDWTPGNLYGRSRHENIKRDWSNLNDVVKKEGQYTTAIAGVIMMLQYPEGTSLDAAGSRVDNIDLAKRLLAKVASGQSVAMPNTIVKWAESLVERGLTGMDIQKLRPWLFDIIETKRDHGKAFVDQRRHKESLIFQGWLVPPRAGLEGQFGTKAEAGEHADVGIQIAEETHLDLIEYVNLYLINPLLILNWGEEAKGTIRVKAVPMVDEQKALFREILIAAGASPAAQEAFESFASLQEMAKAHGLPEPDEQAVSALQQLRGTPEDEVEPLGGRLGGLWRAATGGNGND